MSRKRSTCGPTRMFRTPLLGSRSRCSSPKRRTSSRSSIPRAHSASRSTRSTGRETSTSTCPWERSSRSSPRRKAIGSPRWGPVSSPWRGRDQLAAGFVVYGPQTTLVLTTGGAASTCSPWIGAREPIGSRDQICGCRRWHPTNTPSMLRTTGTGKSPSGPLSMNASPASRGRPGETSTCAGMAHWSPKPTGSCRAAASTSIPATTGRRYREGRLRLLYEAYPLAFLVECAGGAASNGRRRILDIEADEPAPARAADLRLDRHGRAARNPAPQAGSLATLDRAAVRDPRPVPELRGQPCRSEIPSSRSPARPGRAPHRSSGPSSRSFAASMSPLPMSRATAFHRYDRAEMRASDGAGSRQGQQALQPLQPRNQPAGRAGSLVPGLCRDRHGNVTALRP